MRRIVLPNSLTVIVERRPSSSVAVEVSVGVGSSNESGREAGLSHFLEHMLFNGSAKRPSALSISNEIERLGGELNGGTSSEQTCFYAKVPSRFLDTALDVLSDMVLRPLFRPEDVEKERKVILNEIQLYTDDPKLHVWVLVQKHLFVKHPAGNPVYGRKETIAKFSREDIAGFHRRHYVPGSMAVTIVGDVDVDRAVLLASRYFAGMPDASAPRLKLPKEVRQHERRVFREKRRILQSYLVAACKTPPRGHPDSYALDVAHAILGRRSSGRMFDEIRNKRGLAYEVSVLHEAQRDVGIFAVSVIADKNNLGRTERIIHDEFRNLSLVTNPDVSEAKTFLEGDFLLECEDTLKRAELVGFFNHAAGARDVLAYLKRIRLVSAGDVRRVARKYLNGIYTLVIVEQRGG
ncbi:MAG: pitrilysin family protein [Candidatus Altiarchaeota archaeon]|nr:pitrilysin family protein [Candidatus Altiarchaeota archaeon]